MGSQQHLIHLQQGAVQRQWLDLEDVQGGAGNYCRSGEPAINAASSITRPARRVDQDCIRLHPSQGGGIQQVIAARVEVGVQAHKI